jgi:signal transduction histidine kinase
LSDDPEHGEVLREIVDEASRMTRMVEDLLFLARSDSASVPPLEIEEHDLSGVLEEIGSRAMTLARERGAELSTETEVAGRCHLDRTRLSQAVLILVDNAAKYAGGAPIRLIAAEAEGELVITVIDSGPGIPPAELPRVFERFQRGGRRGQGAGLGLSIARTIVEGHGGRIEAQSVVGDGTTMTIRLPIRPPATSSPEPVG